MARTLGRITFAAAVAAATVAMTPGGAGGQTPPGCSPPYSPVATANVYPGGEQLPTVDAAPLPATPLELSVSTPVDSDGDGTDDTVTVAGDTVTIARGDGTVTLTYTGSTNTVAYGVADLNGDGRDEIALDGDGAALLLVPGTVAPGSHEATSVGALLGIYDEPNDAAIGLPDGRVVVGSPTIEGLEGHTDVFDGPTALAEAPGSPVPPISGQGTPVATVDLGDSVPTLLTVSGAWAATSACSSP